MTHRCAVLAPVAVAVAFARPAVAAPTEPDPAADPVVDRHDDSDVATRDDDRKGRFEIGAGFDSDDGFLAHAAIVHPDLFHTGQLLSLSADVSAHRQRFVLAHEVPRLLPGLDLRSELYTTRIQYPGFTRTGTGAAIGLSHRFGRSLEVFGRLRAERIGLELDPTRATSRVAPPSNPGTIDRESTLVALEAGAVYDTLDTPWLPRRGSRFEIVASRAMRGLGSDHDLERIGASLDVARGLGPFTLRLHGSGAYVHALDPAGVPLSERLQFGGNTDVRGYPIDYSQLSVGSNVEALGRVELELPVWKRAGLSIAGWADAGLHANTDAAWGPIGDPRWRSSVGVSLIWRSPIGPLRFDWAFPLDAGQPHRFLFGLGGSW
jgi:outer membrane protein insertion porin family